jgi:hypothetical protein
MGKSRCKFKKKMLGEESIIVKLLKCFLVFQGVFLDVVFFLLNLKSKGVLLNGIGRVLSKLFLGWGWVVGKKGGYSLYFFFFSFLIIW